MRFLLDTCVFIWLCNSPEKLPEKVRRICDDNESQLYLSTASIWEMQLKVQFGKLQLKTSLSKAVASMGLQNGIQILQIQETHIYGLTDLPGIHKDLFDRILISQARQLGATILTSDDIIKQYPVIVLW